MDVKFIIYDSGSIQFSPYHSKDKSWQNHSSIFIAEQFVRLKITLKTGPSNQNNSRPKCDAYYDEMNICFHLISVSITSET